MGFRIDDGCCYGDWCEAAEAALEANSNGIELRV